MENSCRTSPLLMYNITCRESVEMPTSPGDLALRALARHQHPTGEAATPFAGRRPGPAPHPGKATRTARFLDLVTERHGSLAQLPLNRVAGVAATLAPLADLNPGAAPHRPAQGRPGPHLHRG
jgi:hypothetical protein